MLLKKDMAKASVVMGTTVATGTFIVYGLSAIFARFDFKLSFYVATAVLFIVTVVWVVSVSKLIKKVKSDEADEDPPMLFSTEMNNAESEKKLILRSIVMLAFYGVVTNLIKDGLTTWVPSILKEQYHLDDSLSIVLTLALPVVSIFGNAFAVSVHKKIPDFVMQCVLAFLCSGVIIGGVIGGLSFGSFLLTLVGFALVCFLVSSCNSLIIRIFPLFMKGKVNSGLIAGILNGFCYLGSTISSNGLGTLADAYGWYAVFWLLFDFCVLSIVFGIGYFLFNRINGLKK